MQRKKQRDSKNIYKKKYIGKNVYEKRVREGVIEEERKKIVRSKEKIEGG